MDQLTCYRDVIRRCVLDHFTYVSRAKANGVEPRCIFDEARDDYLMAYVGWDKGRRVWNLALHACIRDGKIWVEEDNTEDGIAIALVRSGVPQQDIVLAFHPAELRHLSEFAIA